MSIFRSIVSLLIVTFVLSLAIPGHAFFSFGSHEKVEAVEGVVTFDQAVFDDGKARYYKIEHGGETIKFFVVKSSDNVIRAAFDACDVCWQSYKGYSQEGEFMVCNNCGRRFHSSMINEVSGGCNPAPLIRTIKDGKLVITLDDIAGGAIYF